MFFPFNLRKKKDIKRLGENAEINKANEGPPLYLFYSALHMTNLSTSSDLFARGE